MRIAKLVQPECLYNRMLHAGALVIVETLPPGTGEIIGDRSPRDGGDPSIQITSADGLVSWHGRDAAVQDVALRGDARDLVTVAAEATAAAMFEELRYVSPKPPWPAWAWSRAFKKVVGVDVARAAGLVQPVSNIMRSGNCDCTATTSSGARTTAAGACWYCGEQVVGWRRRDAEIVAAAMLDHDKHYRCLVSWLNRRGKNAFDLADIIGEGSTVAHAIWKKYSEGER